MFDINKFTSDLANYVKAGILTKENAEAVYEAACAKYDLDPETGESNSADIDFDMTVEAALDTLKDKYDDVKDASEKKIKEMKDASEKKIKEVKEDIEDAKEKIKDKIEDVTSEENKAKAKAMAKKAAPIVAASTLATAFIGTGAYKLLSASEKKSVNDIAGLKNDLQNITGQWNKGQIPTSEYVSRYNKLHDILKDKENASVLTKIKSYLKYKKVPDKYKHESTSLDLINQFLEERIQEACAECDPTKNVENEIDEKLPVVDPNEPTPIGCVADIEKTDKAIEDAKKYLDVAAKLAEMKSAHEAEKDTTQQHEVIKQALESEMADEVSLTKLHIYESCDAGIISEEEKHTLLSMFED